MNCKSCRFFDADNDQCRRRSPQQGGLMDFYFGELLRAIALAQIKMAGIDVDDVDEDIRNEATEAFQRSIWPRVSETEWCGEWESHERS